MKIFKYILTFLKELIVARNNKFYPGSDKSYQMLRFLYLISHGYLLKIIEFFY